MRHESNPFASRSLLAQSLRPRLGRALQTSNSQAQTPPDLASSFDTSTEGWRASTNTASLVWQASGGTPDGYLRASGSAGTNAWHFVSPESWAGDWRGLQSVSFDFKIITGTSLFDTRMISICSPWTNLHANVVTLPVPGEWMHYEFALTPATFGVSADTFEQVMQDVVFLGIRSEWITGSEREGLDNYRLSKATDAYWAWIGGFYSGSDLTDENKAGKLADPDGDGADNWSEYVANTVPTNRLDYLRLELLAVTNGVCALGFQSGPGRVYGVDSTTNLSFSASWSAVTNDIAGTGSAVNISHPAGAVPQFYRIRVRLAD